MGKRQPAAAPKGRTLFVKGRSGNPGGNPKLPPELRIRCQELTPEMVEIWRGIARDKKQPAHARVMAAERIIERGYGKAPQTVDITHHSAIDDLSTDQLVKLAASIARGLEGVVGAGSEDAGGSEAGALPPLH